MSAKFSGFWTPSPPCPHRRKTVCPQNWPIFGPPPPSLGADVLNGCPLTRTNRERTESLDGMERPERKQSRLLPPRTDPILSPRPRPRPASSLSPPSASDRWATRRSSGRRGARCKSRSSAPKSGDGEELFIGDERKPKGTVSANTARLCKAHRKGCATAVRISANTTRAVNQKSVCG